MRFKNYKNSYTNDNRIYTKNETLDMTVRELKDRAEEFIAQHRVLGLPDESELAGSENVVHFESYTRSDMRSYIMEKSLTKKLVRMAYIHVKYLIIATLRISKILIFLTYLINGAMICRKRDSITIIMWLSKSEKKLIGNYVFE